VVPRERPTARHRLRPNRIPSKRPSRVGRLSGIQAPSVETLNRPRHTVGKGNVRAQGIRLERCSFIAPFCYPEKNARGRFAECAVESLAQGIRNPLKKRPQSFCQSSGAELGARNLRGRLTCGQSRSGSAGYLRAKQVNRDERTRTPLGARSLDAAKCGVRVNPGRFQGARGQPGC